MCFQHIHTEIVNCGVHLLPGFEIREYFTHPQSLKREYIYSIEKIIIWDPVYIQMVCKVFAKDYKNRYTLQRHMIMVHTNKATFSCSLYNMKFVKGKRSLST